MRRYFIALLALCVPVFATAQTLEFDEGLRFNEGTAVYKNMVLVTNFGSTQFDPLNDEHKGYIMSIAAGAIKEFIAPDGNLSAPKGMIVLDGHLFIADVGRVVVYNLRKEDEKPRTIMLPEGEVFVNDLASVAGIVLVTVTNTGNVYGIDASDIDNLGQVQLMGNVPGANGIAVHAGKIYIASYNASGVPSGENIIYAADIVEGAPQLRPLIEGLEPAQYDGIAVSEDGATLYFSAWGGENGGGAVYSYNLIDGGAVKKLDLGVELTGPADILVKDGYLFVPDLPCSKLYRFKL